MPPPIDNIDEMLDGRAQIILDRVLECAVVGSAQTVRAGLDDFVAVHSPDEVMITAQIFDHAKRLRSYEIVSRMTASQI